MSRHKFTRVAAVFLVSVWTVSTHSSSSFAPDFSAALKLYDDGRYAEFFEGIGPDGSIDRHEFKDFEAGANTWIRTADAEAVARRRLIASSVALELAHSLRHAPSDRAGQYLVWASRTMAATRVTPSSTERLWYLASLAGMEELDSPWPLVADHEAGNSLLEYERRTMTRGGQLGLARARFPDEPRLLLAQAAVAERRVELLDLDVPSRQDVARLHIHDPGPVGGAARYVIEHVQEVPVIISAFQALERIPGIQGEVHLHLGWAEAIAHDWTAALHHLDLVPTETDEAYLRYLSRYLTGRTLQNMGDHAGAIRAFESALATVPSARSAATQLAAEIFVDERYEDRARAYALLRAANSDSAPGDPWRLFFHGDARLWPAYMAQLRQTLR
jgi:tetratricopeptide (TPR) repeat protein